jgi:hypothetical protein
VSGCEFLVSPMTWYVNKTPGVQHRGRGKTEVLHALCMCYEGKCAGFTLEVLVSYFKCQFCTSLMQKELSPEVLNQHFK